MGCVQFIPAAAQTCVPETPDLADTAVRSHLEGFKAFISVRKRTTNTPRWQQTVTLLALYFWSSWMECPNGVSISAG